MRIYCLGILATTLFACAGCSICCTPYDECGPTAMSGLCNTRVGSVISYSGPQGGTTSQQSWEPQRSDATPIPSAQSVTPQSTTPLPELNIGTTPYSPAGYASSVTQQATPQTTPQTVPWGTPQVSSQAVYAWTTPQTQPATATQTVPYPGATYTRGYEPVAQPQMAAIPDDLRQRYPAGRSASF